MTLFPFLRAKPSQLQSPVDLQVAETVRGRVGQGRGLELPPKPVNARYLSLDIWRGMACLMLVLYHATFYADFTFRVSDPSSWTLAGLPLNLLRKCWVGVPIFFVISGYCISASIDSLRRRDHSLWDYCVRRFRRIYPPLWIMYGIASLFVIAMTCIPVVAESCKQLPRIYEMSVWQWIGNFAIAESWRHNVLGGDPEYLMANTWTLCYEEQFYFVTGLLLALASRRFFAASAILTAVVFVAGELCRAVGLEMHGFFWDGHWLMFAAGIMVYHMLNYQDSRRRWACGAVLVAGTVYGMGLRVLSDNSDNQHLGEYLAVAAMFGIALLILRRWDSQLVGSRLAVPFLWAGKRSYSIYLTHYPLVVVASSLMAVWGLTSELAVATVVVPACTLLSLPVAVLFYETVETRFLNK